MNWVPRENVLVIANWLRLVPVPNSERGPDSGKRVMC